MTVFFGLRFLEAASTARATTCFDDFCIDRRFFFWLQITETDRILELRKARPNGHYLTPRSSNPLYPITDLDARDEKLKIVEKRVQDTKDKKLKCGQDIFTHLEVKEETWGALQRRNMEALKRAQQARERTILLKVAEETQKMQAKRVQTCFCV